MTATSDRPATADLILGLAVRDAIDFIRSGLTTEAVDRMTRAGESAARVLGGGR